MSLINRAIVTTLPLVPKPIVRKFSNRYIAGDTIVDAVRTIRELEKEGCCATMDILGEHISLKEEATSAVDGYLNALDTIHSEGINSNVSVKLTQLGMALDPEFCFKNIQTVVEKAKSLNNFVRIDMEESAHTSTTIDIFKRLRKEHQNVGLVVQAYLRRTRADIRSMLDEINPLNLRLCKGIYIEKRFIAYKDPHVINNNFTALLKELFERKAYVGIATHDLKLVWNAMHLIDTMGIPKDAYEFQMLLGVDEELRRIIVDEGHKLRVYVPFGQHWYAYSVRRLKENPQIAGYVVQNLFRR
ncbi:MAG: proline dehydrogenase family protein [Deferribacteres bacterium]|nr:proline dehydrogenase family protein [candidate division KSB1 bacterium]MCB9512262.1 proline dehydrogenase family protein [Deferribacteres bacterium]